MVGFRYFVLGHAERLGLTGWVRNGDDGQTVEVVAEADEAILKQLEAMLHQGPPGAVVDSVEATWSDDTEGFESFSVRS
jgi:acylphosphatase